MMRQHACPDCNAINFHLNQSSISTKVKINCGDCGKLIAKMSEADFIDYEW